MRREEPYQGLTCMGSLQKWGSLRGSCTGAAWLSSARAVRCWVKSRNERNPCGRLPVSDQTATINVEEGGDDVKSARPLRPGRHTRYNGWSNGSQPARGSQSYQSQSQFGWQAATRLPEVGVASNRGSAHHGEYVPGSGTHRPSHHESRQHLKPLG